jgi:hypothetical protein
MSTVVFWAVVGGVLALRLTPLWGIVVGILAAIVGMVANFGAVIASASVLFGTVRTDPGMANVARDACLTIAAACVIGTILVVRALAVGSFWR